MRSRWTMVVVSGGRTRPPFGTRAKDSIDALDVGGVLDGAGHKLDRERRRRGLAGRRK